MLARQARNVLGSLSTRLLVRLLAATALALAVFGFVSLEATRERWTRQMYRYAERTSDLIERAGRYGMLLNRKDDVQQALQRLGSSPDIVGIRIYDKTGRVAFSSDPAALGQAVDRDAEACVACHAPGEAKPRNRPDPLVREFRRGDDLVFGLITPIANAPECSNAACHAHDPGQTVLGVMDVQMSLGGVDAELEAVRRKIGWSTVLVGVVLALVSAVFVLQVVRRPILDLVKGTERVAGGDLDSRLESSAPGELGYLAKAFDRMTDQLRTARDQRQAFARELEEKVREKTEELGRTQRQIVHVEKMASLGRLAATVAHELNNPLSGILAYARLIERAIDETPELSPADRVEVRRWAELIRAESARSGDIVRGLLSFSRRREGEMAPEHLDPIVERSLTLVRHARQMSDIEIETRLLGAGQDEVFVSAGQIEQALVALFVNAIEAMPTGGALKVTLDGDSERVRIAISDTGAGIAEEHLARVFEPFFSTKEDRSGVGLGLAVVYGIVERHGGRIDVESAPGQGTTFRIELPRRPKAEGT